MKSAGDDELIDFAPISDRGPADFLAFDRYLKRQIAWHFLGQARGEPGTDLQNICKTVPGSPAAGR